MNGLEIQILNVANDGNRRQLVESMPDVIIHQLIVYVQEYACESAFATKIIGSVSVAQERTAKTWPKCLFFLRANQICCG